MKKGRFAPVGMTREYTIKQKINATGQVHSEIDELRALNSFYWSFGAGVVQKQMFAVPTTPVGVVRCIVTAIEVHANANTGTATFWTGTGGLTQIFPTTPTIAANASYTRDRNQLGGGIPISSVGFYITPSAQLFEASVTYLIQFDPYE